MAGGAWKVAYSDFMTAMMAFFLLMWLLSVLTEEQKQGIAGMFQAQAARRTNVVPVAVANNPIIQYVDKLELREYKLDEIETSFVISRALRQFLMQNSIPSSASGITSDNLGVLLHVSSDLMFEPGTVKFSNKGKEILNEVAAVMRKYKVSLVVRGHADASEAGTPGFASIWDLSSARANAALRYLLEQGISPASVRSVSYADTRPQAPQESPDALKQNSRVEFNFHRPDTMTTIVGY